MYELYQTYSSNYWWVVPVFLSLSFLGLCIGSLLVRAAYEYVFEVKESKGIYKIFCEKYIIPQIESKKGRWHWSSDEECFKTSDVGQYLPWFVWKEGSTFYNGHFFCTGVFLIPLYTFLALVTWKFQPLVVITLFTIAFALRSMRWCVRKFKAVSQKLDNHIKDKGAHS